MERCGEVMTFNDACLRNMAEEGHAGEEAVRYVRQILSEHRTPLTPEGLAGLLAYVAANFPKDLWQRDDQVERALLEAAQSHVRNDPEQTEAAYAYLGAEADTRRSAAVALASVFGAWPEAVVLFIRLLGDLTPSATETPARTHSALEGAAIQRELAVDRGDLEAEGNLGWTYLPSERVAMLCHGLSPLLTGMRDD